MNREIEIQGRTGVALIKLRGLLRTLVGGYLRGNIREEEVVSQSMEIIKSIVKNFRHLRDETGQLRLSGEMFVHQLERFRRDLRESEFGKFVEVRWLKMDEESFKFKVYIVVLSAGTSLFQNSLTNGQFHESGWHEILEFE